jgi:hypothetical protein
LKRRQFLAVTSGLVASGLIPPTASPQQHPDSALQRPPVDSGSQAFQHPGILHTADDLAFLKSKVVAKQEPWSSGWERMLARPTSSLSFTPQPFAHIFRGSFGHGVSGASELTASVEAATSHVLQWVVLNEERHAAKAIEIFDAWSPVLWDFDGNDAKLLAGWTGGSFCNAAEILRATYPHWKRESIAQLQQMLLTIYVPLLADFFPEANGNWDAAIMHSLAAIGIFCDRHEFFDRVADHYRYAAGTGGILKYVYPSGQCAESTRDQAHTQLGLGYFALAARIALNQGVDLFNIGENRLALGFEYTSRYMLGEDVQHFGVISPQSRGRFSDFYEAVYQHYHFDRGIEMPYTARAVVEARSRSNSTLLFYRGEPRVTKPAKEPAPSPSTIAANAGAQLAKQELPSAAAVVAPGEPIQSAIDTVAKAGGGVVALAAGVHTLQTALLLRSNITLVGAGRETVIHLDPAATGYCISTDTFPLRQVSLRNLLIEGASSAEWPSDPNSGVQARSTHGSASRGGIALRGNRRGDISHLIIDRVTVRNCTLNGVLLTGTNDAVIRNCDFTDNGGAVVPGPGQHHNLSMIGVERCAVTGSRLATSMFGCGLLAQLSRTVTVRDCEAARNRKHGMSFADCVDVEVSDCLLEANDGKGVDCTRLDLPSQAIATNGLIKRNNGTESPRLLC